jgi:transposase
MTVTILPTKPVNGKKPGEGLQTEVAPRAQRRRFTATYKRQIVEEADACREHGQIGALLRREGLYSSQLSAWRKQRDQSEWDDQKSGRKDDPSAAELQRLQQENERLRRELEKARLVIDVQKKLSQVLGLDQAEKDESA